MRLFSSHPCPLPFPFLSKEPTFLERISKPGPYLLGAFPPLQVFAYSSFEISLKHHCSQETSPVTRQSQCHEFCCWHLKFLLVFQEGAPLFTEQWVPPNSALHADLKASSRSCSPQGILYPSPCPAPQPAQSSSPSTGLGTVANRVYQDLSSYCVCSRLPACSPSPLPPLPVSLHLSSHQSHANPTK